MKGSNLDSAVLKRETDDKVKERNRLLELGRKFQEDKKKLEDEIDKVNRSRISDDDKRKILCELNSAVEKLQEQYEIDVTKEQERVNPEIEERIDLMEEAAEELENQQDSLRHVTMDASATDASVAADAAGEKQKEFEQMKSEYIKTLKIQMDQAEMIQREVRTRRLSRR